jgi:DNA polymerase elongation subunit (family B)
MVESTGWILDVYIEGDEAAIWIKTVEGYAIKLRDYYTPALYILPTNSERSENILSTLRSYPEVLRIDWVEKLTNIRAPQKKKLLQVVVREPTAYKKIVKDLRVSGLVEEIYNADLLHVQQYLFTKLNVEPTSKVHVIYDGDFSLRSVERLNDDREIKPPPFSTLYFEIHTSSETLTPNPSRDPIRSISLRFNEKEQVIEGDEACVIQRFSELIQSNDPDLLICSECDNHTFPYLYIRSKQLGLNPQLSREKSDINRVRKPIPYWVRGRVAVDYNLFGHPFEEWGVAGLVERCRFSYLPLGVASRWSSNRVNDSRCCYELIKRGYVIPENTGYIEYIRSMSEVVERDRGGVIIPPKIGVVHENVAELDFESQYPNIIVRECISYETAKPSGVDKRADALLPNIAKHVLERRLYFKKLKASYAKSSVEWMWCEQRQLSLKLILVTLYGTSGCCWNRFGNVLAFEEINKKSREIMFETLDFVQSKGFEVVYGDCDSIFIKKTEADKEDYICVAKQIAEHIGLPITLNNHYKFLILLPMETDPTGCMEAQKHYFGILYDGEVVARGIELRRHDTPRFIKEFQSRLIETLFDCKRAEEVYTVGYDRALQVISEAIEEVMSGRVSFEDLVVSKILRKPISKYKSIPPHVSAAIQLAGRGRDVKTGEAIEFVYTDAEHQNPLCRVAAYKLLDGRVGFDREKYRDMILDAAETTLSTLGFTRKILGLKLESRDWLKKLREEREKEIELEAETEEESRP